MTQLAIRVVPEDEGSDQPDRRGIAWPDLSEVSIAARGPRSRAQLGVTTSSFVLPVQPALLRQRAKLLWALGDVGRLSILSYLAAYNDRACDFPGYIRQAEDRIGLMAVDDLADALGLTQPTVSHHLQEMEVRGLIDFVQWRTYHFYYVIPAWRELIREILGLQVSIAPSVSVVEG